MSKLWEQCSGQMGDLPENARNQSVKPVSDSSTVQAS